MSGRVLVRLADGRRVRGYRKTLKHVEHRRLAHEMPFWHLGFYLPPLMGFGLELGSYPGVIGARIEPHGYVKITGKRKDWLFEQAQALLRDLAPHGLPQPINVHLARDSEPGPTDSGPLRPGIARVHQIAFDGKTLTIIGNGAVRSERKLAG